MKEAEDGMQTARVEQVQNDASSRKACVRLGALASVVVRSKFVAFIALRRNIAGMANMVPGLCEHVMRCISHSGMH